MELRLFRIALIVAVLSAAHAETAAPPPPKLGVMRRVYLQDSAPYEVGLGSVPTTILMPGPIEAFEAEGITNTPGTAAVAFLQHTPGTSFFSVKQLMPGTADLNVLLENALYSFHFYLSDNPTRTLVIERIPSSSAQPSQALHLTARRLYEIVQEAKTYLTLKEQHPELQRPIEFAPLGKATDYNGYTVILDQAFRFDRDDTIVFRVVLLNHGDTPLAFAAGETALRIGRNLYWPSFAQLGGRIPPREPALLQYEISPDVDKVTLTRPDGSTEESIRSPLPLTHSGEYLLTVQNAKGKTDSAKFLVRYPLTEKDPAQSLQTGSAHGFGIRALKLTQPRPGQSFGYVCYSGTADGQRANLSLEQDFTLLLSAKP